MSIGTKFMNFIEDKMVPVAGAIANQRHLKAMRDGLVQTIPITILGGLILMVANPPVATTVQGTNLFLKLMVAWRDWAIEWKNVIILPYKMSFALLGLFAAVNIAFYLAKSYKLNTLPAVVTAVITFLMVAAPITEDGTFNVAYLDAKGMFTGILLAMLTVEITRFLINKNITIKMPDGVPPAVTSSFEALIPLAVNVIVVYAISLFIQKVSGSIIPQAIMKLLAPAVTAIDSAPAIFIFSLLAQLLWFGGIHGSSTIKTGVLEPFLNQNLNANSEAIIAGEALPHIFTNPFWANYMTIGGSGATLALVLVMLFVAKSSQMKSLGKVAILPALFNINEPIIFGTPMVFNPLFIVPFLLAQPINGVIAYYATKSGLIASSFVNLPWTTPGVLGSYLSTFDWKAPVLVIFLTVLDLIMYYPFFKVYDKKLAEEEAAVAAENSASVSE